MYLALPAPIISFNMINKHVSGCIIHNVSKQILIDIKNKRMVDGNKQICDMIRRNESDVGDIGFEILAKTVFQFLCFILFLALTNSS